MAEHGDRQDGKRVLYSLQALRVHIQDNQVPLDGEMELEQYCEETETNEKERTKVPFKRERVVI